MASTDRRLGVSGSAAFKVPCVAATTANITLEGLQTIDGVAVVADDRVLVWHQTNGVENGIYVADTSTWNRAVDFDGPRDVVKGTLVLVAGGSINGSTVFQLTTASPVIDTSSLTFAVTGTPALTYASAFIQTLLDDLTAATARTTLGAVGLTGNDTITGTKDLTGGRAQVPTRTAGDNGTDAASTAFVTAAAALLYAGVRQTVAAGPVTTAGLPSFLPSTNASLAITSQNVSGTAPLVAVAANGWSATTGQPVDTIGFSTANLTWSGLTASRAAATPNFLYGTIAGGVITPAKTIVAPVYQWGGTPAVTSGLITFNISEMKAYLGNGVTAAQTNLVLFGEAATDGSGVISTVPYAYNGKYESDFTATLPNAATLTSASHNIGVYPRVKDFIVECTSTDGGYSVGDQISAANGLDSAESTVANNPVVKVTAKTIAVANGTGTAFLALNGSGTGAQVTITNNKWKYKFAAARGW